MPKSRKSQPAMLKKPRTETPPPMEPEDAIAPELVEDETPTGTPNPGTYVVSEVDTASASGASSAGEDSFITPLPVVPALTGKTSKAPTTDPTPEPAPRIVNAANLLPRLWNNRSRGR